MSRQDKSFNSTQQPRDKNGRFATKGSRAIGSGDTGTRAKSKAKNNRNTALAAAIAIGTVAGSAAAIAVLREEHGLEKVPEKDLNIVSKDEFSRIKVKKANDEQGVTSKVYVAELDEKPVIVKKYTYDAAFSRSAVEATISEMAANAGINSPVVRMVKAKTKGRDGLDSGSLGATVQEFAPGQSLKDLKMKTGNIGQHGGMSSKILKQMSEHDDLARIAALDTFTGNWDRGGGNLFYDKDSDTYTGIDNANSFENNLAEKAHSYFSGKKATDFSDKELSTLRVYRDTLSSLYKDNPPKKMKGKVASYVDNDHKFSQGIAAYLQGLMSRGVIDQSYKDTRRTVKTLDKILSQKGKGIRRIDSTLLQHLQESRQDKDFNPAQHPRDKNGRFAVKGAQGGMLQGQAVQSIGSGNTREGATGKLIDAGESYTNQFIDDPEFAAAATKMGDSRARVHSLQKQLRSQEKRIFGPDTKLILDYQRASMEMMGAYDEFHPIATKKMKGLSTELKADSGISKSEAKKIVNEKTIINDQGNVLRDGLTDYFQVVGSDIPSMKSVLVDTTPNGRSYADPWHSKSVVVSPQQLNKSMLYHEVSHHFECKDPSLVKASEEWVKKRSDGTGQHELSKMADPSYGPGERAYRDFFSDPYAGKVYTQEGRPIATEVISLGMQNFDSPENMASLYALDPEHFNFTLGAIRPKGRTRRDSLTVRDALIEWLQGRYDFDPGLHTRDERGRFSVKDGDRGMGVWYEGRRTAILVRARNAAEAKEKAAKKKKQGGDVATVRKLTPEEEAIAAKGRWVRTGPKGEKPGQLDIPGFGPRPKKLRGESQ